MEPVGHATAYPKPYIVKRPFLQTGGFEDSVEHQLCQQKWECSSPVRPSVNSTPTSYYSVIVVYSIAF